MFPVNTVGLVQAGDVDGDLAGGHDGKPAGFPPLWDTQLAR